MNRSAHSCRQKAISPTTPVDQAVGAAHHRLDEQQQRQAGIHRQRDKKALPAAMKSASLPSTPTAASPLVAAPHFIDRSAEETRFDSYFTFALGTLPFAAPASRNGIASEEEEEAGSRLSVPPSVVLPHSPPDIKHGIQWAVFAAPHNNDSARTARDRIPG